MALEFIQATEGDKSFLMALRLATMVEHLEREGIYLTEHQHNIRLMDNFVAYQLIYANKKLIGAVKFTQKSAEIELMQLQIAPEYQGKGYGSAVINRLKTRVAKIKLTVLKHNPAFHLYQQLGFVVTGDDQFEYHMQWNEN
ncbi:GNAT family N-acetyltransferase [Pseudoalteromonas prydzensis]|nr:GNAT family N-acetyltransferase [Pseudoalteromonas prydzensis]